MGDDVFIYAHDTSGSTSRVPYYFKHANIHKEAFKAKTREKDNVHYLLWESLCEETTLQGLEALYSRNEGRNGTQPHSISNWIIKNRLQHKNITLWLITDGEIHESDLIVCKSLNIGINFVSVKLITINEQQIDNSISFAFFNNNCKITIIEEIRNKFKKIALETNTYDFDKITAINFMENFDELSNYVISKYTIDYNKS